jgi:glyoxylase-like metal-dependent hydrolase (beta-lactamase superfamily II)
MPKRLLIAICWSGVFALPLCFAQSGFEGASGKSYARARQALDAGIKAMGGLEALREVSDVTRELAGARSDQGQGLAPFFAEQGGHPPVVNRPQIKSVRDLRGQRMAESLADTILGGQPLKFLFVLNRDGAFSVNQVARTVRQLPAAAIPNIRTQRLRRYPESLLLAAWNRPETLRWIGEENAGGAQQQVITFADSDGAQVTLYFDAETRLLTKSEALADDPVLGAVANETVFSDWRAVGDLRLPFRYTEKVGGVTLQDLRASSIVLNQRPPDSAFALPATPHGLTKVEPPPQALAVRKLADDVYAILGSYNSLFVVFNDYVLVVEAGASSGYTQACIAEIKRVAPNKPIRYLVATHFHFDHVGGVRSYIAEGATIVTTLSAKTVIERAAAANNRLRPDALSRNPRPPVIETVKEKKVFDDGVRRVELYEFASPHVREMIVVYLPKEKILFQGDLLDLDLPEGGAPAAGADTADLLDRIERWQLDVRQIVPVHGRLGTMDDLRRAVAQITNK